MPWISIADLAGFSEKHEALLRKIDEQLNTVEYISKLRDFYESARDFARYTVCSKAIGIYIIELNEMQSELSSMEAILAGGKL